MIEKKLNVKKLGIFCGIVLVVLILIIMGISSLISDYKLKKTDEYKLGEVGYTENEIKVIKDNLKEEEIENIINSKYKKNLTKFIKEKYFIYDNLERYLSYYNSHGGFSPSKIIGIINTNSDSEWYENILETDTSKEELMLVNKFYGLSESYEPSVLVKVSSTYAYSGKYVSEVIYEDLKRMLDAARDAGYTLVVSQGYRSYKDQSEIYKDLEDVSGTEIADTIAARPGHSEYQTGLSVLLSVYGKDDEEATLENDWLKDNCYKYGFIIRYEEDTEDITGFSYDKWRVRYVGVNASSKIHSLGITFDEYYEYFVKDK